MTKIISNLKAWCSALVVAALAAFSSRLGWEPNQAHRLLLMVRLLLLLLQAVLAAEAAGCFGWRGAHVGEAEEEERKRFITREESIPAAVGSQGRCLRRRAAAEACAIGAPPPAAASRWHRRWVPSYCGDVISDRTGPEARGTRRRRWAARRERRRSRGEEDVMLCL